MKEITMNDKIKLFIDEPLNNLDYDEFGHRHYVNVIKNILDNCQNEKLNIGLFGKWGVGKTTIIDLLKYEIGKGNYYKTVTFECWKYSNETISLKRKFLLEVAKQTGAPTDDLIESFYIKGTRQTERLPMLQNEHGIIKCFKYMANNLLLSSITIFIMNLLFYFITFNFLKIQGESVQLFFSSAITATAFYSVRTLKDYSSNVTITKSNENLESLEQFEKAFIKLIQKFEGSKKKTIVFVDDLDRCQSREVIEILETIKAFMDIKNCIFIIACDDLILKKALKDENIDDINYLDKIFQVKVSIPPFRQENIRNYALKLLKNSDISIPLEKQNEIIDVLIYKNVLSPRKVKILLNNYIILYSVLMERLEENKYLSNKFILDFNFLAKITVLQTEFIDVYFDLEKNNRLLEYIEKIRRGNFEFEESQKKMLFKYYNFKEGSEEVPKVKEEYKEAIEYLYYSSFYMVSKEQIRTYIYLSQDNINAFYSDEYVERLEEYIISRNVIGFISEFKKIRNNDEKTEMFKNLLLRVNEYENIDIINALYSVTETEFAEIVPQDIKKNFANTILTKIQQNKAKIKNFNIKGVVDYIKITEEFDFYSDIIDEYIDSMTLDDLQYSNNVLDGICINEHLIFNINKLDKFLVELYKIDYKQVIIIIEKLKNNQKSLEKYFVGEISSTIMDYNGTYLDNEKEVISDYLSNISNILISRNHNLLVSKMLKYINDKNKKLSSVCIEIINSIISLEKVIENDYILNIIDMLCIETGVCEDEVRCSKIFQMIIKIGESYQITEVVKANIIDKLCNYYNQNNEYFIKSYTSYISQIVRIFGNIDKVVNNIVTTINSLSITSNGYKYLINYISGIKEDINHKHNNIIFQSIYTLMTNTSIQIRKDVMTSLYLLIKDCSFIIEQEKVASLAYCLIDIANAQNRSTNAVSEEIVNLTYNTYEELMYLFVTEDLRNRYFNSILLKLENDLLFDFALNKFIQKYTSLTDDSIKQKILLIIISKDSKQISENAETIIEIFIYYGSEIINQLLNEIFKFINREFNMSQKIKNLNAIISKLNFQEKDTCLSILNSMYLIFEKNLQKNIFNILLFKEKTVRKNTIDLFIEKQIDSKYLYTLECVSTEIENEEEKLIYYEAIDNNIRNAVSLEEIRYFLNIFVALKDKYNYLSINKTNQIINDNFIYLIEGSSTQKKAALETLVLYYNENKLPRSMGAKLLVPLNKIIINEEELREIAIETVKMYKLNKIRNKNAEELNSNMKKYEKLAGSIEV